MSQQNSLAPADDRPSQSDGGALQLPVKLDATDTGYSHANAPQYKIQGQIPIQEQSDLVLDLSALRQAGDWYVDTYGGLYVRGKSYTQGTPNSRYVKVQQIATKRPRIIPIETTKLPIFATDIESSLKEIGVSATIPGAAVVDLVERYATSSTDVIAHELRSTSGVVGLLAHAKGTQVSVDVDKPYAGWKQDVQEIKDKHEIEAIDPQNKDHVRAMVRPVLGAVWGTGEYEARLEVPDPDLDRLYELADAEGYGAIDWV